MNGPASSLDLVFCMAGRYRRFRTRGYQVPKFLLPWHGRPVLAHILAHMASHPVFKRRILVANHRDRGYRRDILAAAAVAGVEVDELHFIDDTDGQASTARIGCQLLTGDDAPVVFHNVDTLIAGRNWWCLSDILERCHGCIDTFPSQDPCYSYVSLNRQGLVEDIREKQVISHHATSGCYAFTSRHSFIDDCLACDPGGGERYISDVYRRMLQRGNNLDILTGKSDDTLIFGTPAQYEERCQDQPLPTASKGCRNQLVGSGLER